MSHNLPLIIASRRVARASSLAPSFSSSLSFLSIGQFSTQVLYYSRVKTETKKVTWASVSRAHCIMMKPEVQPFSTIATACNLTWFSCLKV